MLKSKEEIENYEDKVKFLNDNGWVTWYHDDNWINEDWYNDPNIRIDMAGMTTEQALKTVKKIRQKLGL